MTDFRLLLHLPTLVSDFDFRLLPTLPTFEKNFRRPLPTFSQALGDTEGLIFDFSQRPRHRDFWPQPQTPSCVHVYNGRSSDPVYMYTISGTGPGIITYCYIALFNKIRACLSFLTSNRYNLSRENKNAVRA